MKPSPSSGGSSFDFILTTQMDYNGTSNPVYVGQAFPGSSVNNPCWRIQYIQYNGSGQVTSVQWSPNSFIFGDIWANRASLSYS